MNSTAIFDIRVDDSWRFDGKYVKFDIPVQGSDKFTIRVTYHNFYTLTSQGKRMYLLDVFGHLC